IEEACKQDDPQRIVRVVRALRSQGSSVGFEPISAAAAEVERKLTSDVACDVIREAVQELIRWCLLARASNTNTPQEENPAADEKQAVAKGAQAAGADDPI
ncbi:MAG: Hpt domain-containing protein, partial [Planctomycetota bacterium]